MASSNARSNQIACCRGLDHGASVHPRRRLDGDAFDGRWRDGHGLLLTGRQAVRYIVPFKRRRNVHPKYCRFRRPDIHGLGTSAPTTSTRERLNRPISVLFRPRLNGRAGSRKAAGQFNLAYR